VEVEEKKKDEKAIEEGCEAVHDQHWDQNILIFFERIFVLL